MNLPSGLRAFAFGSSVLVAASLAGCGAPLPPPPPGHLATSVPAQAINDGTFGLVRIRLGKEATLGGCSAFGRWMQQHDLESTKADYLAEQLRIRGLDTILIPLQSDERMLDDVGIYVGGEPGSTAQDVEDALLKTGGLNMVGAAASMLTVKDLGNGWFFVGVNGDGIVTDASAEEAREFSDILERLDDCPAALVFPAEGFEFSLDEITFENQSRLVRRLRSVAKALDDAEAIAATISRAAKGELVIVFPTAAAAQAFGNAIAGIRKDMLLALEGSEEQGEVTKEEAARERAMIERLRADIRDRTVVLLEE